VVDILDEADAVAKTVAGFGLFAADYGKTVSRTDEFVLGLAPGAYQARARVVEAAPLLIPTRIRSCSWPDRQPDRQFGDHYRSAPVLLQRPDGHLLEGRHHDDRLTFRDTPVTVQVRDPAGQPLTDDGVFQYQIPLLPPRTQDQRYLTWHTGVRPPGQYAVHQAVAPVGLAALEANAAFEIAASTEFNDGLAGTISAAPGSVEQPASFTVTWSLTNTGNTALTSLTVSRRSYPTPTRTRSVSPIRRLPWRWG